MSPWQLDFRCWLMRPAAAAGFLVPVPNLHSSMLTLVISNAAVLTTTAACSVAAAVAAAVVAVAAAC